MAAVKGQSDPAFSAVKQLLSDNVSTGEELGASICINVDGLNVVDIWAGYVDEARSKEWQENTIVNAWSTSKTVTNLAALIAADRGLLDLHGKVATYWPEFAANGKENIEVRHILAHSSGLSAWEREMSTEDICNLDLSTAELAKQAPLWEPGTASGYHSTTQGALVSGLISRVTGKSLKQFIAEDMAAPLGADFQLGALEKDWPRVSTLLPAPPLPKEVMQAMAAYPISLRTFTNPPVPLDFVLGPTWRNAELGAVNGHGNARSLNRIMSAVTLGGEVDGVRLLSKETIDKIFEEQTCGTDLAMLIPVRYGIGYGLPLKKTLPAIPEGDICFWFGYVRDHPCVCAHEASY